MKLVFETRGREARDGVSEVEKGCLAVKRGNTFRVMDGDVKG